MKQYCGDRNYYFKMSIDYGDMNESIEDYNFLLSRNGWMLEIQQFDRKVVEKLSLSTEKETQEVEEEKEKEKEEDEEDYEHIYDPVYEDEGDNDNNHYEDPKDFNEDMTQDEDNLYRYVI